MYNALLLYPHPSTSCEQPVRSWNSHNFFLSVLQVQPDCPALLRGGGQLQSIVDLFTGIATNPSRQGFHVLLRFGEGDTPPSKMPSLKLLVAWCSLQLHSDSCASAVQTVGTCNQYNNRKHFSGAGLSPLGCFWVLQEPSQIFRIFSTLCFKGRSGVVDGLDANQPWLGGDQCS